MATKTCSKCGIEKDVSCFQKNNHNTDRLRGWCRICGRKYVDEHIEEKRKYEREHQDKRREYVKIAARKYRQSEKYKLNLEKNKERNKQYQTEYRKTDKFRESQRKSRFKNKGKYKKNNELRREQDYERYHNDLNYNIVRKLRTRFYNAVRRNSKRSSILNLVGCSIEELKIYIESLFKDGMSWDLYFKGEIHIDHIIPIATFDMTDYEEQKKCFHWSNLQPLWGKENNLKGCLYNGTRNHKKT
jgi:hypothetical protein